MVRLLTFLLFVCIALTVIIPLSLMVSDGALQIAEPIVCTPGEKLVRTGTRNIHFDCVLQDGDKKRDVDWLPLMLFVPLVGTIFVSMLLGLAQNRRKTMTRQPWQTQFSNGMGRFTIQTGDGGTRVITSPGEIRRDGQPVEVRVETGSGARVIRINPDDPQHPFTIENVADGANSGGGINLEEYFKSEFFDHLPADKSLKTRLEQLQEAHNAGLISDEEFERKKQDILNSL